jgi:outer membrane protein
MAQLNQAMGVEAGTGYTLADDELPAVAGESDTPEALIDRAVRARPELAALALQREAQERTVRSLQGGYGPALSATAGGLATGGSLDRLVPNWFVGASLSWSLFSGGFTTGQVREARGSLAALTGQQEALRLQVRVEVEQARLGVAAAKATIAAADEALKSGREQLRLAEARYTTGLGSAIELDDAQVAFSNARAQQVQARYGLAAARAQLMTAVGMR